MKNDKGEDVIRNVMITLVIIVVVYYVILAPEQLIPAVNELAGLAGR